MKKFLSIILTFIMLFAMNNSTVFAVERNTLDDINERVCSSELVFANDKLNGSARFGGTCSIEEVDISNGDYILIFEEGNLYIVPSQETCMGGGIGRCTVQNKTFSYSVTRSQAEAALEVINRGEGAIESLNSLLLTALGAISVGSVIGLSASIILNFIGGESVYTSNLRTFLASGKSIAYFKFDTHCVNRGYMYGDPMYDYVVDNVRMIY